MLTAVPAWSNDGEQPPGSLPLPPATGRFFRVGAAAGDGIGEMGGTAICRLLMRLAGESALSRAESRRCSLNVSGSAGETLGQLAARRVAFAIVPAALAASAYGANAPTQSPLFADIRAVFSLGAEPLHLVVGRDTGIASFADLRGRRINIGAPYSAERELMEALFAFYQLRREDLAEVTEMAPGRVAAALCAGDIDAFGLVVGGPAVAVARATDECGARLLPVPADAVQAIVATVAGTTPTMIPQGMFATTAEPVPSLGVVSLLVTSAEQDEGDVYALTRTVMEHLNEIRGYHPVLADLAPERMVRDGILVPLHPGAQRYFRERGWLAGG